MTTETKHTPGPWSHEGFLTVFGPNGLSLCHTSASIKNYGHDTAHANARLIAAAPTMLAVLKELLTVLRATRGMEIEADAIEETIRQAEGGAA